MLCCVGLIGGMAVGQSLGGPWTYIAPAAGFGIGLVGDMKFMHRMQRKDDRTRTDDRPGKEAAQATTMESKPAQLPPESLRLDGG